VEQEIAYTADAARRLGLRASARLETVALADPQLAGTRATFAVSVLVWSHHVQGATQ
jgi:hypothetical protein